MSQGASDAVSCHIVDPSSGAALTTLMMYSNRADVDGADRYGHCQIWVKMVKSRSRG